MRRSTPLNIPKEELVKLLKLRKDMLISPKSGKYTLGRLVFDNKNQEFGFIIGPMKLSDDADRVLLVTLGEDGPRVRYSRLKSISVYEDITEGINDLDSTIRSDVFDFCDKLCIHECSELCTLYKYKK